MRDVRNIKEQRVELGPGLNVFLGKNAQGKTSLLEGVGLLARGRSFRTDEMPQVVRQGAPALEARATAREGDREVELAFRWEETRRSFFVDGRAARPREYQGKLEAAVYSTDRLRVVHGPMRERRLYVDRGAAALSAGYRQVLREYERVVRQRNAALEGRTRDLQAWDERLIRTGGELRRRREEYVTRLDRALADAYRPAGEDYAIRTQAPGAIEDELQAAAARERAAGRTLVGPHRDPIRLLVNGQEAAGAASSGQVRSLLLALTQAALEVYRERTGRTAVALLDDLDSELDAERAADVCRLIASRGQALVTSAHPEWVALLGEGAVRFRVSGGEVAAYGHTA